MKTLLFLALLGSAIANAGVDSKLGLSGEIRNIDDRTIQIKTGDGKIFIVDKAAFPKWTKFHPGEKIDITVRPAHIKKMTVEKNP